MNKLAKETYEKANEYVDMHPFTSAPESENEKTERIAFHAAFMILNDKLTNQEKEAVMALWVKATMAQRSAGWSTGYKAASARHTETEVAA